MGLLRWLVRTFLSLLVRIFFREVKSFGEEKIPRKGAVLFVAAPHANQFVDPLVLLTCSPRKDVFNIIAQKSLDRKYIGKLAQSFNPIGVKRPQDYARTCSGKILSEGKKVQGKDTKFSKEVEVGWSLSIKEEMVEIEEVISDEELLLKNSFSKDITEITPFRTIPKLDQSTLFENVWETLNKGFCVCIFPEGGSHDRTDLLPLKAGFALMALGAISKYPELEVTIVPTGLNYFHPHKFRSRAYVDFGNPIVVTKEMVSRYVKGGKEKREVIGELVNIVEHSLRSVTVTAPSFEVLQLFQTARRLYKPLKKKLTVAQKLELTRRLALGYSQFKDEAKVHQLEEKVGIYNQKLHDYGLTDRQVKKSEISIPKAFLLFWIRVFRLLFLFTFALPGVILNTPAAIIIKMKAKKKAVEAKASSSVKIKGNDVLATWKVLIGMVLLPINYLIYAAMLGLFLGFFSNLQIWWKIIIPIVSVFIFPFMSYWSVRFFEISRDLAQSLIPLIWAIFRKGENLRALRTELVTDIRELVEEFGPKVFKDFESKRIVAKDEFSNNKELQLYSESLFTLEDMDDIFGIKVEGENDKVETIELPQ